MNSHVQGKSAKRTFWAVALFYLLIAFEFFYMASPFAVYFYSVYRPGLSFINDYPRLAWLTRFFLPHIVAETTSTLINILSIVGMVLFFGGLLAFSVGAVQVYYRKLAKKGPALGGVYRHIRHPQYLALAVSGLGLLLLWPRYIVLLTYVTVLFAYWVLARAEEKECVAKFGRPYEDYLKRTGMFLPFGVPSVSLLLPPCRSRAVRAARAAAAYLLAVTAALGLAYAARHLSIHSLYAYYTDSTATVSLVGMDRADLEKVVGTAFADERVRAMVERIDDAPHAKYLNYVLPADWYVSELPMGRDGLCDGNHFLPSRDRSPLFRVVITRAVLEDAPSATGRDILLSANGTIPVTEAVVDTKSGAVVGVHEPTHEGRYEGVPLPTF
jgi:protein-S-isoprenylcysteine O-methyltransferase Ste14